LAADPRQADYLATVSHYAHALAAHEAAVAPPALPGSPLGKLLGQAERGEQQTEAGSRVQGLGELQAERAADEQAGALHLGFVNLAPVATALATMKVPGLGGVPGKLVNEAIDLPGQTFLAGAKTGYAGAQAVKGNTVPGAQLLKGVASQVTHPIRSFEQAPLATALTLAGGENAIGRLAGGAGRLVGGDAVKAVLSEDRAPLELGHAPAPATPSEPAVVAPRPDPRAPVRAPALAKTPARGEPIAKLQKYNPDPLRKAAQVGYEKALPHLPGKLAQKDPFVAEGWRLQHNLIGGKIHPGRIDYNVQGSEQARKAIVKSVVKKVVGLKPSTGGEAVPLYVDGTIRPGYEATDLAKRKAVLEQAQPSLGRAGLKANKVALGSVNKLLADKAFLSDPADAIAAARRYVQLQKPITAMRVVHGGLREGQTRARLLPYALSHMGARYFSEADHAAAEGAALNVEKGAQARADQMAPGTPEHAAAQREVIAARAHRYEVSGRDGGPEVIAAHEQSIAEHGEARKAVVDGEKRVQQAEHARSRLTGSRGAQRPAQDAAVQGAGSRLGAADAKVSGAKEALRVAQGREREAMDAIAPKPKINAAMRTAEGKHLPDAAIEAHARAHGIEDLGFISHKAGRADSGSFYQSLRRQPALENFSRTGASYLKGTADHSFKGLAGHLASEATKVAQHEGRTADLKQFAQGNFTREQAQNAADNFNHPESRGPGAERAKQLGGMAVLDKGSNQILERGQTVVPRDVKGELQRLGLAEHAPATAVEHGKYAVIPKDVVSRMQAHDDVSSARTDYKRFLQAYTQSFRHVKFALSPKHIAGVTEENIIRPVFEQAGIVSKLTGAKFQRATAHLAELDQHGVLADNFGPLGAEFRQTQGVLAGRGGLVTSSKENEIVRKVDQWQEASAFGHVAQLTTKSPPFKAWLAYRKGTEAALAAVEHQSRSALIGRALKQTGFINSYREALNLQDEGMQALVRGQMTPNLANHIARVVDDMGGNWNHQTPLVRGAVSTVTPFGLWWLNSMRWLYRLPVTHPLKTAILSSLYNATRSTRNAEGQGYQAAGVGTREHPNYLQGTFKATLPVLGNVRVDLGHYSPLGVAGPDAPGTAAEQLLPQGVGVLTAAEGENPLTHKQLTQASGAELTGPQKITNALSELASGPTAGATQLQQLLQGGKTPYGTSNLITQLLEKVGGPAQSKPGPGTPIDETLVKLLNPVKVYKEKGSGSAAPVSARSQRAVARSEHASTFAQERLKRAVERSERR
jgi:hypothetical protein